MNKIINFLKAHIPFIQQIPELKNKEVLKSDIIAWITVAIILIPQAMAYSSLVWVPPTIGLYTAFLPVIIGGIFSSSRQLSTWPVTVISLMTATTLAPFFVWADFSNQQVMQNYINYVTILAILVWSVQILFWVLKLWSIFNFLSHAVVVWFINAAAIIIWLTQAKKIFWIQLPNSEHFYQTVINLFNKIFDPNIWSNPVTLWTFLFWWWSILLLFLMQKFTPKLPRFLIVVILSIIFSYYIWFEKIGWSIVWNIPSWLPNLFIPDFSLEIVEKLLLWAMIVAFMWFTEAISIAKAIWLETKKTVSTNQMLFSEWMANLASGFTKGYPISGTFARSAVNLKAGAQTQFASIVAWLIVWIVLLFFTKYLYHLPNATLAAIIIAAVAGLFKIYPIKKAWKIQKSDAIISIITFIATIVFAPHLEKWIFIWVFLALAAHLYQSMAPRFAELSLYKDWVFRDASLHDLEISKNIWVYRFYWKLFFVNIWYYQEKLMKDIESQKDIKVVILDFELIPYLDSSAVEVIESIVYSLKKNGIKVYFTSLRSKILKQFKDIWFIKIIWEKNIFPSVWFAIKYLKENRKDLDLWPLIKYTPKKTKLQKEKFNNKIKKIVFTKK